MRLSISATTGQKLFTVLFGLAFLTVFCFIGATAAFALDLVPTGPAEFGWFPMAPPADCLPETGCPVYGPDGDLTGFRPPVSALIGAVLVALPQRAGGGQAGSEPAFVRREGRPASFAGTPGTRRSHRRR